MSGLERLGPAAADTQEPPARNWQVFHVLATESGVRDGLTEIRAFLDAAGLGPDICGTVEIAMAEVLNNIVEHAFEGAEPDLIRVSLVPGSQSLTAEIVDSGRPLPGLAPPAGRFPRMGGCVLDLPEGGFGWFLIRTLTDWLSYRRIEEENCLHLRFAFPLRDDSAASAGKRA